MNLLVPLKDILSTRENEITKFILQIALIFEAKDEVLPLDVKQTLNKLIIKSTIVVMITMDQISQIGDQVMFHNHFLYALCQISGGAD